MVLGPALPGALGFLAPRLFSLGLFAAAFTTLISVALTMTYFCLDLAGRDWRFTDDNRLFKIVFAAVDRRAGAGRAVLAAAGADEGDCGHGRQPADGAGGRGRNPLLRQPSASWAQYRANAVRNLLLGVTLLFALALVANGLRGWF